MSGRNRERPAPRKSQEPDPFAPELCARRRRKLAASIRDGVAVLFAAAPGGHADPFRQSPDLLYLSGCDEQESALALFAKDGKIEREILYCRARDRKKEKWNGPMLGLEGAKRKLRLQQAKAWSGPEQVIRDALEDHAHLFIDLSGPHAEAAVGLLRNAGAGRSAALVDLRAHVGRLRMVKDQAEIAAIERATKITVDAFMNAAEALAGSGNESMVAAALSASYIAAGGRDAFQPIVACGANACIAHYVANRSPLRRGRLLLIDSGCQLGGYCSDSTRVLPVGGAFTEVQRDLVSIVVSAQQEAIGRIKPGAGLDEAQQAASMELARGLKDLGISRGTPAKIVRSAEFSELYFHSIGHMLGIEVHDPYILGDDGKRPPLRRGNVVTVEPGLYLDGRKGIPSELRNTGVRIEDLLAVTSAGARNLSSALPKKPDEIERLMGR